MSPPILARLLLSKRPGILVINTVVHMSYGIVSNVVIVTIAIVLVMTTVFLFQLTLEAILPVMPRKSLRNKVCSIDECSICLATMYGHECIKLPCGHVFHEKCALRWRETSKTCALCRQDCWIYIICFYNRQHRNQIDGGGKVWPTARAQWERTAHWRPTCHPLPNNLSCAQGLGKLWTIETRWTCT